MRSTRRAASGAASSTVNYFLTSRTGIEMIDVHSGEWSLHHWARGACVYGLMPANGLIYGPPHPCACYPEAKLSGFNALAGARATEPDAPAPDAPGRLTKGPAFGAVGRDGAASRDDWPTFRGNIARSGSTAVAVEGDIANARVAWRTRIGGKLSAPVVAAGRLFVARVDAHTVHALDRDSGEVAWTFAAGGRVDSPPTFHEGTVIFGSADGHVYCLRASDGMLVWRFRAAPVDRRLMAWEQLESVWPVHGSVLVREGVAYVIAGRRMLSTSRGSRSDGRTISRPSAGRPRYSRAPRAAPSSRSRPTTGGRPARRSSTCCRSSTG